MDKEVIEYVSMVIEKLPNDEKAIEELANKQFSMMELGDKVTDCLEAGLEPDFLLKIVNAFLDYWQSHTNAPLPEPIEKGNEEKEENISVAHGDGRVRKCSCGNDLDTLCDRCQQLAGSL